MSISLLKWPTLLIIWEHRFLVARGTLVLLLVAAVTALDWWTAYYQQSEPMRLRWYASPARYIEAGTQLTSADVTTGLDLLPRDLDVAPAQSVVGMFARHRLERGTPLESDAIGPEPVIEPSAGEYLAPIGVIGSGTRLLRVGMYVTLSKDKQQPMGPARVVAVSRKEGETTAVLVVALSSPAPELDGWVPAIASAPTAIPTATATATAE